jgi:hypothetical protein
MNTIFIKSPNKAMEVTQIDIATEGGSHGQDDERGSVLFSLLGVGLCAH